MIKLTNIVITLATPTQARQLAAELEDSVLEILDVYTVRIQVAQSPNAKPADLIRVLEATGYSIDDWHSCRNTPWSITEIIEQYN